MKIQPSWKNNPYRRFLIPYDPENLDPRITPESIQYIESRQAGLTDRDIEKLDGMEWFTFHWPTKTLTMFAIPGLRPSKYTETRYVKRYNAQKYWTIINDFLAYMPSDFPEDQADRCRLPAYRLTPPGGDHFYPVEYNGDLPAWRKRLLHNAVHFGTTIGYFDHGRFVISDGREIEFADMDVASYAEEGVPPDF